MESFEDKFKAILAKDPGALKLVDSIVQRGFDRDTLVRVLGEVTSPGLPDKLKRAALGFKESVFPPRKRLLQLATHLERDATVLEKSFGNPVMRLHPRSKAMLDLAKTLHRASLTVREFPLPKGAKQFSYKAMWQRIPIFLLCAYLKAPRIVRFREVQDLLVYAAGARGKTLDVDRSVARKYRRFTKTLQAQSLLLWWKNPPNAPQGPQN